MFKRFDVQEDIKNRTQVKSSVQRAIRNKIIQQYPHIEGNLEEILPKKAPIIIQKYSLENVEFVTVNGEAKFFNHHDGPYYPTMKLLLQYPSILPKLQVDKGAIKFILSGANIMCPGLTSKGADMPVSLPEESIVAIFAEGKKHPLAIGITKMSTEDIKKINKGNGVDLVHYLNDGLWKASFAY
ncbi:hypothetical protein K502DRAFT_163550 [Neoconidiobolus thromboides FSU 785]|nr:hypothetical protein K502DRAFT_163550 [Neoconidiobolus thromboides FSU 785]